MANSSLPSSSNALEKRKQCFHCKTDTSRIILGWRLNNGSYAELCKRCGSAYENQNFCHEFHSGIDGWRDCNACGKRVHCGCIVSINSYVLLDSDGVKCSECWTYDQLNDASQASSIRNAMPAPWRSLTDPSEIGWSNIPGVNGDANLVEFSGFAHCDPSTQISEAQAPQIDASYSMRPRARKHKAKKIKN